VVIVVREVVLIIFIIGRQLNDARESTERRSDHIGAKGCVASPVRCVVVVGVGHVVGNTLIGGSTDGWRICSDDVSSLIVSSGRARFRHISLSIISSRH
jgi:hypothetical protein